LRGKQAVDLDRRIRGTGHAAPRDVECLIAFLGARHGDAVGRHVAAEIRTQLELAVGICLHNDPPHAKLGFNLDMLDRPQRSRLLGLSEERHSWPFVPLGRRVACVAMCQQPANVVEHMTHQKAIPNDEAKDQRHRGPGKRTCAVRSPPQQPIERQHAKPDRDELLLELKRPRGLIQARIFEERPDIDPVGRIDDAAQDGDRQEQCDIRVGVDLAGNGTKRPEHAGLVSRGEGNRHRLVTDAAKQHDSQDAVHDNQKRRHALPHVPPRRR
jgi:hypothetical protein